MISSTTNPSPRSRHEELPLGKLYYEISRHNPPALSIRPGERVRIETEDTFNGLVRVEGDRRDLAKKPQGNPQSGPIWSEGAEKGDTLAVHVETIEARIGQAANDMTWARRGLAEFLGHNIPVNTRIAPVRDGKVWWSPSVALPYRPMIGTIGCAPDFGSPTTSPAGDYGGNMDLKEITDGNTVYLPVYVDGALLHLGDAHAAQGDGELCGTALEMPATVTMTIDLLKGRTIPRPRIRSKDEIMGVATGRQWNAPSPRHTPISSSGWKRTSASLDGTASASAPWSAKFPSATTSSAPSPPKSNSNTSRPPQDGDT